MKEKGHKSDSEYSKGQEPLPADAELYGHTTSFDMYASKGRREAILEVTNYHSGRLHLSKEDLESLLRKIQE